MFSQISMLLEGADVRQVNLTSANVIPYDLNPEQAIQHLLSTNILTLSNMFDVIELAIEHGKLSLVAPTLTERLTRKQNVLDNLSQWNLMGHHEFIQVMLHREYALGYALMEWLPGLNPHRTLLIFGELGGRTTDLTLLEYLVDNVDDFRWNFVLFHHAAQHGNTLVCRWLLGRNFLRAKGSRRLCVCCDHDIKSNMTLAFVNGQEEVVYNIRNECPAFHLALMGSHWETCRLLLRHGARPHLVQLTWVCNALFESDVDQNARLLCNDLLSFSSIRRNPVVTVHFTEARDAYVTEMKKIAYVLLWIMGKKITISTKPFVLQVMGFLMDF